MASASRLQKAQSPENDRAFGSYLTLSGAYFFEDYSDPTRHVVTL
jgi:hypothetical protein